MGPQYAPIAPVALLHDLFIREEFGEYHMCLAQEVLKHEEAYYRLYHGKGHFVILDNGASELGAPITKELFIAARTVSATVICVPDFLRDRENTVKAARVFQHDYGDSIRFHALMLIPQGKDYGEIQQCAAELFKTFITTPEVYWGIPRWIANELGSRKPVIDALRSVSRYNIDSGYEAKIHLLGMSKNLGDDMECVKLPGVMGIDSANPIVMGQQGMNFWASYDHLPRKTETWDFWQEKELKEQSLYNIQEVRRFIGRK